ncbi:hypothetical protein [Sporosarcina sp. USHLN248]|uniref:hypothetical protein n=1 Tax=Sporosarcina sp. USHLN248 TaxID=3081300 RepID=UPI003016C2DB
MGGTTDRLVKLAFLSLVMAIAIFAQGSQVSADEGATNFQPNSVEDYPRSIAHAVVDVGFAMPYKYFETKYYGVTYRGYLQFDYSIEPGLNRYSGTLYRYDLPYPIPPTRQLIEQIE